METLSATAAILIVLVLLGSFLFVLRRRGAASFHLPAPLAALGTGPARERQIEVLERASLGPQHALHLVRVGGRRVLIATAPGVCQILEEGAETAGGKS